MWLSLAIDGGINIMNNALKGLQPEKVFMFFEELTQIPHGSHNTKQISDFCVDFAKKRGLKVYQDEYNNALMANCDIYADFDDWYDNKNAKVLCIMIK